MRHIHNTRNPVKTPSRSVAQVNFASLHVSHQRETCRINACHGKQLFNYIRC
jgi:hypothetical protein